MLILGVHVSRVLLTTLFYVCERCGTPAAHTLSKRVRRLSVFFIPVLPLGATRYVDCCTACGREVEITREQADAALSAPPRLPEASGPQDSPSWTPQDS